MARVICTTAPFDAQWAAARWPATNPPSEATLTMAPPPSQRISGSMARGRKNAASRVTAMV